MVPFIEQVEGKNKGFFPIVILIDTRSGTSCPGVPINATDSMGHLMVLCVSKDNENVRVLL